MSIQIHMPKLGESVVEGTVFQWLKEVGDTVQKDEPLVEIETDKVTAQMPSPVAGVLTEILAGPGEAVAVGGVIAVLGDGSDPDAVVDDAAEIVEPPEIQSPEGKDKAGTDDDPFKGGVVVYDEQTGERFEAPAATPAPSPPDGSLEAAGMITDDAGNPLYSPAIRKLVAEHGIDVSQITGTGDQGRVTRKDIEKHLAGRVARKPAAPQAESEEERADTFIPVSRIRRTIANRMVESKRTVPHAWTMVEVDVTSLVNWRELVKEDFRRREGVNLTYLPFVIKAAVEGLKEFPIMNSQWDDDRIVLKRRINIGIAVDLDDGLVVPVIKNADQMSIIGLAHAVADLAARARAGKLTVDDVQGGTFTVNNTGAFGSIMSAPIINYPQAAILSMETIIKRPVVRDDAIAIRSMMNVCCSIDHRILDGAVLGRFLKSVKRRLESYRKDLPLS